VPPARSGHFCLIRTPSTMYDLHYTVCTVWFVLCVRYVRYVLYVRYVRYVQYVRHVQYALYVRYVMYVQYEWHVLYERLQLVCRVCSMYGLVCTVCTVYNICTVSTVCTKDNRIAFNLHENESVNRASSGYPHFPARYPRIRSKVLLHIVAIILTFWMIPSLLNRTSRINSHARSRHNNSNRVYSAVPPSAGYTRSLHDKFVFRMMQSVLAIYTPGEFMRQLQKRPPDTLTSEKHIRNTFVCGALVFLMNRIC